MHKHSIILFVFCLGNIVGIQASSESPSTGAEDCLLKSAIRKELAKLNISAQSPAETRTRAQEKARKLVQALERAEAELETLTQGRHTPLSYWSQRLLPAERYAGLTELILLPMGELVQSSGEDQALAKKKAEVEALTRIARLVRDQEKALIANEELGLEPVLSLDGSRASNISLAVTVARTGDPKGLQAGLCVASFFDENGQGHAYENVREVLYQGIAPLCPLTATREEIKSDIQALHDIGAINFSCCVDIEPPEVIAQVQQRHGHRLVAAREARVGGLSMPVSVLICIGSFAS